MPAPRATAPTEKKRDDMCLKRMNSGETGTIVAKPRLVSTETGVEVFQSASALASESRVNPKMIALSIMQRTARRRLCCELFIGPWQEHEGCPRFRERVPKGNSSSKMREWAASVRRWDTVHPL